MPPLQRRDCLTATSPHLTHPPLARSLGAAGSVRAPTEGEVAWVGADGKEEVYCRIRIRELSVMGE